MSDKKQQQAKAQHHHQPSAPIFNKENYKWIIAGIVIIAIGMLLMAGGKNKADEFDQKLVYSTTRITIAPLLIVLGLIVEVFAIFRKPKNG